MNPKHAERYLVLERAYLGVAGLQEAAKRTKPDQHSDRRGIEVQVSDICDDGSCADAYIELPLYLGRKLFPMLLDIIGDALADMGAPPPKPRKRRNT